MRFGQSILNRRAALTALASAPTLIAPRRGRARHGDSTGAGRQPSR